MQATVAMSKPVLAWLLGRGVAKALGFEWRVADEDYAAYRRGALSRPELEGRIRAALGRFQEGKALDSRRLRGFLDALPGGWEHRFVTTNWNTLLDRALAEYRVEVVHLNGSLDAPEEPLLIEHDMHESFDKPGFRALLRASGCVIAGLSLRSTLDRRMLERLCSEPTGPKRWWVVNPESRHLEGTCRVLSGCVERIALPFEAWVEAGLPGIGQGMTERA